MTSILISGGLRTLDKCLPTLHWHVFRHFPEPKFYVSTVHDEDAWKWKFLVDYYGRENVIGDLKESQPEFDVPIPKPEGWTPNTFYSHEPYEISVDPQAIIGQLWQLSNVYKVFQAHETRRVKTVIRCRPDLWFHSFQPPKQFNFDTCYLPWWGRFGGCNDRFAIMSRSVAGAYFSTYGRINELIAKGCPLHPESLIKASLERDSFVIDDTLKAEFSTLRKDGRMRPPEISLIDLAHCGL